MARTSQIGAAKIVGRSILFLTAENGALPGGKVGGLGDVVRDLPVALAKRGWRPTVLTPAYGVFSRLPGATRKAAVEVSFGGETETVDLYEVPGPDPTVRHLVLDHPLLSSPGPGRIYHHDDNEAPYATDARKFAFFCAASAAALCGGALEMPQIVHLHDWQPALLLVLRAFDPACAPLKKVRTVFTIHNLAFQGIRPLDGSDSSFRTWFPKLEADEKTLTDPRWPDCVNPMAAGIRLADGVNTVSPAYAREIVEPSSPQQGRSGGEGLEEDLRAAQASGRLFGILNGCTYPEFPPRKPSWRRLLEAFRQELASWIARETPLASAHYVADKRLATTPTRRPSVLLTSIGRISAQKTELFRERTALGPSALEAILADIGSGFLVMLGSGEPEYEAFLTEIAISHDNFLFLRGYSDRLTQLLYPGGDLFLMPSSFEPCGISQMLAMRAGQPCVVHGVGGLRDTVSDNITGFVFRGETRQAQADNFVARVRGALEVRESDAERWRRMRRAATETRFSWEASATAYEKDLYGTDAG